MDSVIFWAVIIVLVLIIYGIRYLINRAADKVTDGIFTAIDKKRGKMEETEQESLADKLNGKK